MRLREGKRDFGKSRWKLKFLFSPQRKKLLVDCVEGQIERGHPSAAKLGRPGLFLSFFAVEKGFSKVERDGEEDWSLFLSVCI